MCHGGCRWRTVGPVGRGPWRGLWRRRPRRCCGNSPDSRYRRFWWGCCMAERRIRITKNSPRTCGGVCSSFFRRCRSRRRSLSMPGARPCIACWDRRGCMREWRRPLLQTDSTREEQNTFRMKLWTRSVGLGPRWRKPCITCACIGRLCRRGRIGWNWGPVQVG